MCSVRAHLKWSAELGHCSSLLLKFTPQVYCSSLPVSFTPHKLTFQMIHSCTESVTFKFTAKVTFQVYPQTRTGHLQVYCKSPSSLLPLPQSPSSLLAESLSSFTTRVTFKFSARVTFKFTSPPIEHRSIENHDAE